MQVTGDQLREALRRLVSGVTVLTTEEAGRPWGMTVSAFTPVSLDPPLALVCVNSGTATARHLLEQRRVGINVLAADQTEISGRCASPGTPKFLEADDVSEPAPGWETPRIAGALVALDTTVDSIHQAGTHHVVILRIQRMATAATGVPLLYGGGRYLDLAAVDQLMKPTPVQPALTHRGAPR